MWFLGELSTGVALVLKRKPPDGYPSEEGRCVMCNGYSQASVPGIWETCDMAISVGLEELAMAGADPGAILNNKRSQDG
jgi:hypothetical protein